MREAWESRSERGEPLSVRLRDPALLSRHANSTTADKRRPSLSLLPLSLFPHVVVCLPFSRRARTHIRTHAFIMRVISGAAYIVTGGAKRGERTFRRKQ